MLLQIMEWLSFRTIALSPITEEKLTLVSISSPLA